MAKRAYSGNTYSMAKRGRYTRRRRYGRRYARTSRTRRYYRRRISRRPKPEVKTAEDSTQTFTLSTLGTGDGYFRSYMPNWNSLPVGPTNSNRVGNVIGPCTLQFRYSADLIAAGGADPYDAAGYLRVIVLQMKASNYKGVSTGTQVPRLEPADLFSRPLTHRDSHLMTLQEGISSVANVFYDRTFHMDLSSSSSSIAKRLRFNVINLRWFQDFAADEEYATNPVVIYFFLAQSGIQTEPTTVQVQALTTLRYYDA